MNPYYVQLNVDENASIQTPTPFDDKMCDLVVEFHPEVVSFHFGLPDKNLLVRVRGIGAKISVQFSKDPEALNQYFRQMTPNERPYDPAVISDACAELFNKIGPAIFVTHSQGGGLGWATVLKNGNVRGIVAYEPGSGFLFPDGEVPEALQSSGGTLAAIGVPMAEFMKLTKIPIIVFYGDFIPEKPSENPGQDGWRVRLEIARKWRDTVNRHGGDVTVVHLPEIGIRGNTHFPMSDMNNRQVADQMSTFLSEKKLD